jgi:hypothetical protein
MSKFILILDERLKTSEKKLLDTHLNSYILTPIDYDKHFYELPQVDCYIVKSSSEWWDWNIATIKEQKIGSVYYSKGRLDNPECLLTDFIITKFPKVAKNKEDLMIRLAFNSLPKPKSRCNLCCGFLCDKITLKDLCSKMFSCFQCLG